MGEPVAFSRNSKMAIATHFDRKEVQKEKFSLRLWDIIDMKPVRTIARFSQGLRLIGFSPDGKELVICHEPGPKPSFHPSNLRRLEVESGKQFWNVELPIKMEGEVV